MTPHEKTLAVMRMVTVDEASWSLSMVVRALNGLDPESEEMRREREARRRAVEELLEMGEQEAAEMVARPI